MRKQLLAVALSLLVLLAVGESQNMSPAGESTSQAPEMSAPQTAPPLYEQKPVAAGKYNGPGGCAASSCHGSIQPKTTTRVLQNEYTTWISQDKHARAYGVLKNKVSERIGKILNLGKPPAEAPKCLVCHSLYEPPEQQAQTFELGDGVSCENCHGPASGWLGPHTTKNWPHEKSVQLGCLFLTAGRIAEFAVSTRVTSFVASRFHFFRRKRVIEFGVPPKPLVAIVLPLK